MILGHAPSFNHNRLSPPPKKPAPSSKDNHCPDCLPHDTTTTSLSHHLATCLHQQQFPPTPNRFSVLADPNPAPTETKWAFDFVPTATVCAKRRGKRGGKHHKGRNAGQLNPEGRDGESITDLCKRIAALRLNDDGSSRIAKKHVPLHIQSAKDAQGGCSFEYERPHWAPQFRPNTLPAASTASSKPISLEQTDIFHKPQSCVRSASDAPPPAQILELEREASRHYPLSAFLACTDSMGRYPSKSKFLEAEPRKTSSSTQWPPVLPCSPNPTQQAVVSAARGALASKAKTTLLLCGSMSASQKANAWVPPLRAQTSSPPNPLEVPEAPSDWNSSHPRLAVYPLALKFSGPLKRPISTGSPSVAMPQRLGGACAWGPSLPVHLPGLQPTGLAASAMPLPPQSLVSEQHWRNFNDRTTVLNPAPTYQGMTQRFSISAAPGWELPTPYQIGSQEWQRAMNNTHEKFHQQPCWCSKHDYLPCRARKLEPKRRDSEEQMGIRRTKCPEGANDTNCSIINKAEDTLDIAVDSVEAAVDAEADGFSEGGILVGVFGNTAESSDTAPASSTSQRTQSAFEDVYCTCGPHSPSVEGWIIISRPSHQSDPYSVSYPIASWTGEYVSISPPLAPTPSWDAVSDGSPMSPFQDISLPDDYPKEDLSGNKGDDGWTSAVEWPTIQETMMLRRKNIEARNTIVDDDKCKRWDGVTDWFMQS